MVERHRLRVVVGFAVLGLILCRAPAAHAAIGASATIQSQQLGPNSYEYSLKLTNTGDTPIGTFWYAWAPFYDLLPTAPTSIISPSGWTGINAPDYYGVASVQWKNTVTPLQPGQSLTGFKFDTSDPPNVINGPSIYGIPTREAYVYIGEPQTDPGAAFVATVATPEPGSLALLLLAAPVLVGRRRR
jgi:hypothetical protein